MTPAPRRAAVLATLLGQIAFGMLAMAICLPSMPQWGALFGASPAQVQLSFAAYVAAFGICQLFYGPWSDRLGRKRLMLLGMAVAGLGSLLAGLASTLETLVAARVVQGAGGAAGMVLGRALIQDLYEGADRARVMAFVGMTLGVCPPLASLVGGQVHVRWGWQFNFAIMAVLALVLLVAAAHQLPSDHRQPAAGTHWLRGLAQAYARLLGHRRIVLYMVVLGFTSATFYAFLGGAPAVLGAMGIGPQTLGWYILMPTGSYVIGNFITSRALRHRSERWMMGLGQATTALGMVLMVVLALADAPLVLTLGLSLALLGLGHGFLMPGAISGTVGTVPALAGSAAALSGLAQQLTGALGSYSVGLVEHDGVATLGAMMLGFTLCAVVAQRMLNRPGANTPTHHR